MNTFTPEQLVSLPPLEQYVAFVKLIAQQQEIWGLYDEDQSGWALSHDGERERLPLWPEVNLAEACRQGDWLNCTPLPMDVHVFMRETTDELIDAKRGLSVMYIEGQGGLDIEPEQLRKDLLTLLG